jgi:hypothetical protein
MPVQLGAIHHIEYFFQSLLMEVLCVRYGLVGDSLQESGLRHRQVVQDNALVG